MLVSAGVLEINIGERHLEHAVMAANKGFANLAMRCPVRSHRLV